MRVFLDIDRVFLSLADEPQTSVTAGSAGHQGGGGARTAKRDLQGEFRYYTEGRARLFLGSTDVEQLSFTLRALPPDAVRSIELMIGQTVLFRDTYGRKVYGIFLSRSITDIPLSGGLADYSIVMQLVDYDEPVS